MISSVPLCAPAIPSNVSRRLPGFFIWCVQGYARITNRRLLDNKWQWGIKTRFCEVTSAGVTGNRGRTEYEVFHFQNDCTIVRNSARSTRGLRTVGLVRGSGGEQIVPPGKGIRYSQDGSVHRLDENDRERRLAPTKRRQPRRGGYTRKG